MKVLRQAQRDKMGLKILTFPKARTHRISTNDQSETGRF